MHAGGLPQVAAWPQEPTLYRGANRAASARSISAAALKLPRRAAHSNTSRSCLRGIGWNRNGAAMSISQGRDLRVVYSGLAKRGFCGGGCDGGHNRDGRRWRRSGRLGRTAHGCRPVHPGPRFGRVFAEKGCTRRVWRLCKRCAKSRAREPRREQGRPREQIDHGEPVPALASQRAGLGSRSRRMSIGGMTIVRKTARTSTQSRHFSSPTSLRARMHCSRETWTPSPGWI